jgi:hypothetical protein
MSCGVALLLGPARILVGAVIMSEGLAHETTTMSNTRVCPACGAALAAGVLQGACPVCLAQLAVRDRSATTAIAAPPDIAALAGLVEDVEIERFIGAGGMGAVYCACQTRLDRRVALKILPLHHSGDPAFVERFLREARALARLNHPHIVTVHDARQSGPYLYILMEYVDGASLRELISGGKLDAGEALRLVPQICDALQYAHDRGVVHRDIKPENILLDQDGQVRIADFGLAMLFQDPSLQVTLTAPNVRMGSVRYMAPEQMKGSAGVDHRADIYALGVTFYEMLTGAPPALDFKPPSRVVAVDRRVDGVVARTLKESPAERYQQAAELKRDVERIAASPPSLRRAAALTAALMLILALLVAQRWPAPEPLPEAPAPPAGGQPTVPVEEPRRYCLRFEKPADIVEFPSLQLDRLAPLTIEVQVLPTMRFPAPLAGHVAGPAGQASLFVQSRHPAFAFSVYTGEGLPGFHYVDSRPMAVDRPIHVAGVRDAGQFRLYVDGKCVGVKDQGGELVAPRVPFRAGGYAFAGFIHELRISTSARYRDDFVPRERFEPDADTLALYHCDEGQGTVLGDASGHGHDGNITGATWARLDEAKADAAPR